MGDKKISDEAVASAAELLYKGAKMLSKHCPECGLPLFEKDGKVFCSNCGEMGGDTKSEAKTDALEDEKLPGVETAERSVGDLLDAMEAAAIRVCEMIEKSGDAEEVRLLTESLEKLVASMERARKIYLR